MDIKNIFSQLNLKPEHQKIYLANLEWGTTSITNIARKSGIPRTSIYILLKELLDTGLVTQHLKSGKKVYSPAEPEFIGTLLEQKQVEINNSISNLNNMMNELKAVQNTKRGKPKVEFLEGPEGIKQAYERTFETKEIWIQCLTENYKDIVEEEYFNDYFDRFFKKSDIRSKEILRFEDDEYVSEYGSDKNLQLRIPVEESTETDFWVYDNKVTFVSFNKENPYALVIEDSNIANSMQNMYNLAWKKAKDLDPRVEKGEDIQTEF